MKLKKVAQKKSACIAGGCPAVFETDIGTCLIIGSRVDSPDRLLSGRIGPGEVVIEVSVELARGIANQQRGMARQACDFKVEHLLLPKVLRPSQRRLQIISTFICPRTPGIKNFHHEFDLAVHQSGCHGRQSTKKGIPGHLGRLFSTYARIGGRWA